MSHNSFSHLILLIGTNPLPNFVIADYFLRQNPLIEHIWLIHSEGNTFQAGTDTQAEYLEAILNKKWKGQHQNLQFPLEKISLSDVSDAKQIYNDIQDRMLNSAHWKGTRNFHLNYTGGTKSMSLHAYWILKELPNTAEKTFSYLDARNFRLIDDQFGITEKDLRNSVHIKFPELIALHGFEKYKVDPPIDFTEASKVFQKFTDPNNTEKIQDGHWLEAYISGRLEQEIGNRLHNPQPLLQNWKIDKPSWKQGRDHGFELDVIVMHGYHLTGISCTITSRKKERCKNKGFEIMHRTKQIGGDEAKAVLVTGTGHYTTEKLREELLYDTGGSENILVLGIDELRHDGFVQKITDFIF